MTNSTQKPEYITQTVSIESIEVGPRLRSVSVEKIDLMVESLKTIGLRTPITVRITSETDSGGKGSDRRVHLVAGATRLEAAKKLEWPTIEANVLVGVTDVEARLWEIAENLHRAELTVQERSDHVDQWVRLTEEGISAQVAPKRQPGRPQGGINAASRELGLERRQVQRSLRIAGMTEEAKVAAREHGLDDNQSALLEVAQAPRDEQARAVREIAANKARKRAETSIPAPDRDKTQSNSETGDGSGSASSTPSHGSSGDRLSERVAIIHRAISAISSSPVTADEFWSTSSAHEKEHDRIVAAARRAREKLTEIVQGSYRG